MGQRWPAGPCAWADWRRPPQRGWSVLPYHGYRPTHPIGLDPAASQTDSSPARGTSSDPRGGSLRPAALRSRCQKDRSEWGQRQTQAVRPACPRLVAGPDLAVVTDVAARVQARVGVQHLAPRSARRHADTVLVSRDRCEIAHHHQHVVRVATFAQESKDAVLVVVRLEPVESVPVEIHFVQRRMRAVHAVEVRHTALESALKWVLKEVPI